MNNWETNWFILSLAREHQQNLLREAGLDHSLRRARIQNQPAPARAVSFGAWVARALGFHRDERVLER